MYTFQQLSPCHSESETFIPIRKLAFEAPLALLHLSRILFFTHSPWCTLIHVHLPQDLQVSMNSTQVSAQRRKQHTHLKNDRTRQLRCVTEFCLAYSAGVKTTQRLACFTIILRCLGHGGCVNTQKYGSLVSTHVFSGFMAQLIIVRDTCNQIHKHFGQFFTLMHSKRLSLHYFLSRSNPGLPWGRSRYLPRVSSQNLLAFLSVSLSIRQDK